MKELCDEDQVRTYVDLMVREDLWHLSHGLKAEKETTSEKAEGGDKCPPEGIAYAKGLRGRAFQGK